MEPMNNYLPDDLFFTLEQYDTMLALFDPSGGANVTSSQPPTGAPHNPSTTTTPRYFGALENSANLSLPEQSGSPALDSVVAHGVLLTNRGLFSNEQKELIRNYCNEPPSVVLERLQQQDPSMTQNRRQVKGAVENERRKQRRREPNGPWTQEEVEIVRQNLDRRPRDVMELLKSSIAGFRKNVDQVRDVKNQLVARARDRQRGGAKTTANSYVE